MRFQYLESINKDLKVVKKVVTVAGKYDVYEKDGTNVKGSTLDFSTPEDVNKWRNKLLAEEDEIFLKEKEKYSKRKEAINQRMDEVLDVMLMEV